jgi:hypothetical protein
MDIDLEPHEWRSQGRAGEPFFGPGLPAMLAYFAGLAISMTGVYFALH